MRLGREISAAVMVECYDFLEGKSWEIEEFKGLDLSGIILRNSSIQPLAPYMNGVILRGADLTRVDFDHSNFEGADLSNAILRETGFFQSVFEFANLSGADLTGAGLVETSFWCADFSRAKLNKARISSFSFISNNLTEATFKGARLHSVDFDGAKLTRTDFREADFGVKDDIFGVNFRHCYFKETLMPDGSVRNNS